MTDAEPVPIRRDRAAVLAENVALSQAEAPIYERNHFEIFHPFEQDRLRRHLRRYASAQRVLDVGAGTGNAITKLEAPVRVALDLSPEMLGVLGRRDPTVLRVVGVAEALPFVGGAFELVVMYSTAHHLAETSSFTELHRVMAAGGSLLVEHEEAFQRAGWRRLVYRALRWPLRAVAAAWYWWRPAARPYMPYRRVWWPYSDTHLAAIDFALTDGGQPDADAIEVQLAALGMSTRRWYYLLEPLPMLTCWQRLVDRMCALGRFGHFAIEATR
jgi:SAM-dependent methyltransferase